MNMATEKTKVVFVGIGGYASVYLRKLFENLEELPLTLVAGVDPFPESSQNYNDFRNRGGSFKQSVPSTVSTVKKEGQLTFLMQCSFSLK